MALTFHPNPPDFWLCYPGKTSSPFRVLMFSFINGANHTHHSGSVGEYKGMENGKHQAWCLLHT